MAELTPIPTAQRPSDPGYQPLSGYAVAAALAAGLFLPALLLFSSNVAILVLPITGLILSVVARAHIRRSEGTRTGLKLVAASWWVCVLGGVAIGTYIVVNELVLESKSKAVVDRFFADLNQDKPEAFKWTLPTEERGRVEAQGSLTNAEYSRELEKAYQSFGYTGYRGNQLVQIFERNAPDVQWEHIGSKGLGADPAGMQIIHIYRVSSREAVMDVNVRLVSLQTKKSGRVDWHIPFSSGPGASTGNLSISKASISRYGLLVGALQGEGGREANAWLDHLAANRFSAAYLKTLSEDERQPREQGMLCLMFAGGAPATNFPIGPAWMPAARAARWRERANKEGEELSTSEYQRLAFDDLVATGFFRRDETGAALTDDQLSRLRRAWWGKRIANAGGPRMPGQSNTARITLARDVVTVAVPAEIMWETRGATSKCLIGLECRDPEVLAQLQAARDLGAKDLVDSANAQPIFPPGFPPRSWRVVWLQSDLEVQSAPETGGPPKR